MLFPRFKRFIILSTVLSACFLQGCVLVPFIDAFKKTGVAESDRQAMLGSDVKKFTDALVWGSQMDALSMVQPEAQSEIAKQISTLGEGLKVVDAKVNNAVFTNDAYEAEVNLTLRFYESPYFVVKNQKESQKWVFSLSDGWKLKSRTING